MVILERSARTGVSFAKGLSKVTRKVRRNAATLQRRNGWKSASLIPCTRAIRIMSEILAGQREGEKVAPFTAAYFGSLRNRSCINKEYPQSPTTVPIAIPFHLQLHSAFPPLFIPLYSSLFLFSPTVPPRRLKLSRRVSSFYPPDAFPPPLPSLLETMRLPIAFAILQFHRTSQAHILLLTSPPPLSSRKRYALANPFTFL